MWASLQQRTPEAATPALSWSGNNKLQRQQEAAAVDAATEAEAERGVIITHTQ
jgi:hypothetical protein